MGALILDEGPALAHRSRPRIAALDDVLIEVLAAGLCRTDLYVANGTLAAPAGVVLGHEGAGLVRAAGERAQHVAIGALVGIDPRVPCGQCHGCLASEPGQASPDRCLQPMRLGVEMDGVFADFVRVPAACVVPIHGEVEARRAAYLEPVAAALGALNAGLRADHVGAVAGEGRIAELTARILEHAGLPRPRILTIDELSARVEPGSLDFVIDAGLQDERALETMIRALQKHGTLVLKSRSTAQRSFVPADWVAREITVAARSYGSFERAAQAIADPALVLEDLFAEARPLSEFREVFAAGERSEAVKPFFRPSAD